jgi:hypothetical protein
MEIAQLIGFARQDIVAVARNEGGKVMLVFVDRQSDKAFQAVYMGHDEATALVRDLLQAMTEGKP